MTSVLDPNRFRSTSARLGVFAVVMLGVFGVTLLDYVTGVRIRIFPLYFIPIAAASYLLSMRAGLATSLMSGLGWLASNWLTGEDSPGTAIWVFNTVVMTISFLTINYLIARLHQSTLRERNFSRRDALTGLANSRAFHESAELLCLGAARAGRPFTIAYLDLDNFKTVNDQQGHAQGDNVLRAIGAVLAKGFRRSDLVARIGGDEFVAFLPDTDESHARVALDHARTALLGAMAAGQWPVTVSVGAVAFPGAAPSLKEAMHCADSLMYEVKRMGKNRILTQTVGPDLRPLPPAPTA